MHSKCSRHGRQQWSWHRDFDGALFHQREGNPWHEQEPHGAAASNLGIHSKSESRDSNNPARKFELSANLSKNATKWPKMNQSGPNMTPYGPRMTQHDPKWPKIDPKWHKMLLKCMNLGCRSPRPHDSSWNEKFRLESPDYLLWPSWSLCLVCAWRSSQNGISEW